jgi:hypothetical protein
MNEATTLKLQVLGNDDSAFEFAGTEVPEKINFGGTQMLNTQKMVGGLRVVESLGADDATITWSGIFYGPNAIDRAQYLNQVRRNGNVCRLTWESFQYTVVISEFKADFNKRFWIQYSMSCQVVEDEVAAIAVPAKPSPNDALNQDSATVTQLSSQINLQSIVAAAQAVSTAIVNVTNAVHPIANGLVSLSVPQSGPQVGPFSTLSVAANAAILAAHAPLAVLQNSAQAAIANNEQAIEALPSLGYIDPEQPMSAQVNALVAQCNAATQLPSLYELNALTYRMQDNLDLVADPARNNQIVTGGGNLYQLAAQEYGDATRWTDIAGASGIGDPMMTGFHIVTVPQ